MIKVNKVMRMTPGQMNAIAGSAMKKQIKDLRKEITSNGGSGSKKRCSCSVWTCIGCNCGKSIL